MARKPNASSAVWLLLAPLALLAACDGGGARSRSAAPTAAPATNPPAAAVENMNDNASSKVDALAAEIAAKEAEYQKAAAQVAAQDRAAALPPPEVSISGVSARGSDSIPAPSQPTTGTAAPIADGRDETWWKNQMRTLETRLEDDLRQFNAAMAAWKGAIESMNTKSIALAASAQDAALASEREAQRLKAVVQNDRDAVERLREDARRAGVPPGWLRWP